MSLSACGPLQVDLRAFVAQPGRHHRLCTRDDGRTHDLGAGMMTEGEVAFDGTAWTQLGTLYATGTITATLVRRCRRCLKETRTTMQLEESLEVPFAPDADCVDLAPTILGAIAAVHDPLILCQPDCRGLCPRCGANLNDDPRHRCPFAEKDERRRLGDLLR